MPKSYRAAEEVNHAKIMRRSDKAQQCGPETLANFSIYVSSLTLILQMTHADSLKRSAMLAVVGGDGFDGLARQVAQQTFHVGLGVFPMLGPIEHRPITSEKLLQFPEAGDKLLSGDLDVGKRIALGRQSWMAHETPSLVLQREFITGLAFGKVSDASQ